MELKPECDSKETVVYYCYQWLTKLLLTKFLHYFSLYSKIHCTVRFIVGLLQDQCVCIIYILHF